MVPWISVRSRDWDFRGMMEPRIAWLSASLFLLPVMKLRVVRGMVEGDDGVNDIGRVYGVGMEGRKEGRKKGGSMIGAASLACDY